MTKRRIADSLGALLVLTGVAAGEPDRQAPTPWSLTALVGTDVGLDVAAGIQLEAPFGLRLTATAGWMPHAYAWGLAEYYETVYDGKEAVGNVVEDLLSGAFVGRLDLGYRPLADRGLFFGVGYTFQTSSKDSLLASQLEGATGRELRGSVPETERRFETSFDGHMLDATIGWQWGIGHRFSVQAALGVLVVVHTSTSLSPLYVPDDPSLTQAFVETAENILEDAGTGIVAPIGTVYLGYTF